MDGEGNEPIAKAAIYSEASHSAKDHALTSFS
jgi:hypothetical protein